MKAPPSLDDQIEFLRAHGAADVEHSWSSLVEHLLGTRELLQSWGASGTLCTAGLFHSVYGTESFGAATVGRNQRHEVRSMVGRECEILVYLFSVMTGTSFEDALTCQPTHQVRDRITDVLIEVPHARFTQLCNLSAANWLEQRPRLGDVYVEMGRARYKAMLPLVLPAARKALQAAYGFVDERDTVHRLPKVVDQLPTHTVVDG